MLLLLTQVAAMTVSEMERTVARGDLVQDLGKETRALMSPELAPRLEVVFMKQIRLLRERAVEKLKNSDSYASQAEVEAEFCRLAEESGNFDYSLERAALEELATALILAKKKTTDLQLDAARQQSKFMRIYQTCSSQIQQLQASQFTRGLPMQAGFAWRIQQINLSGSYAQGRARLEVNSLDDNTILSGDPPIILAPSHGNLGWSFVV